MNKFQWNFNQNSSILIQENALENVVCEMASILSRAQCVNDTPCTDTSLEKNLARVLSRAHQKQFRLLWIYTPEC